MAKFTKKPIVIEATQFFYDGPRVAGVFYPSASDDGRTYVGDAFVITAHDQRVYLENGDWIIPEMDGEHYYPCKPDIFEATYQPVQEGGTISSDDAPRRRIICTIELGADSWKDAAAALDDIAFRLHEAREKIEERVSVSSGGPSSGWTLDADERAEITHDSYMTEIEAWLAEKKQEREEAA